MNRLIKAIGNSIVYLFSHHKVLMALLFALTAGNQFEIPEWVNGILGLLTMFTIIILMLKSSN